MTPEEKKMKRYTAAVERRLNLSRTVKVRVMSDFISSIQARREAGMSDEAIFEELGDPKKAAADLNEQMKEYTYRKSPWRYLFAACGIYGAAELFGSLAAKVLYLLLSDPVYLMEEAASIGIIGGADGPTSIFVATPGWTHWVVPAVLLAVGIWGYVRLSRCKQK